MSGGRFCRKSETEALVQTLWSRSMIDKPLIRPEGLLKQALCETISVENEKC